MFQIFHETSMFLDQSKTNAKLNNQPAYFKFAGKRTVVNIRRLTSSSSECTYRYYTWDISPEGMWNTSISLFSTLLGNAARREQIHFHVLKFERLVDIFRNKCCSLTLLVFRKGWQWDERSCRRSERKDDGSVRFKSIVDEYSTSIDICFS